jgi:hypothetical protein
MFSSKIFFSFLTFSSDENYHIEKSARCDNRELKQVTFLTTWMPARSELSHYRWQMTASAILV